jgi:hypothetical protein
VTQEVSQAAQAASQAVSPVATQAASLAVSPLDRSWYTLGIQGKFEQSRILERGHTQDTQLVVATQYSEAAQQVAACTQLNTL